LRLRPQGSGIARALEALGSIRGLPCRYRGKALDCSWKKSEGPGGMVVLGPAQVLSAGERRRLARGRFHRRKQRQRHFLNDGLERAIKKYYFRTMRQNRSEGG